MMEPVSRRVSSNQIVGRARELELGCGVLQRALDGSPGRGVPLLLISGEAGIGKTRLLDELLGRR
jgi:predicted ATPase